MALTVALSAVAFFEDSSRSYRNLAIRNFTTRDSDYWRSHRTGVEGTSNGTVMATRSAFIGGDWQVSRTATAAREVVVGRAASAAHACALRGNMDCGWRGCDPAVRTRTLSGGLFPLG